MQKHWNLFQQAPKRYGFYPLTSAILAGLSLLTMVGCGGATNSTATSATTPGTTQPSQPSQPSAPAGWVNVDRTYFSFSYPIGWHVDESTSGNISQVVATEPTDPAHPTVPHQVYIVFDPGLINQGLGCTSVDEYLVGFYNVNYLSEDTLPNVYPNVNATYDGTDPGFLGGARLEVSVAFQAAVGANVVYQLIHLEGVPKATGLYVVGFQHPSESYDTEESFRKTFFSTIIFKSQNLPSTVGCHIYD